MATRTHNGGSGSHRALARKPYVLEEVIDFAVVTATPLTLGSTDTYQVLKVPIGSFVSSCGYQVLTAESGNATAQIELGDGVDTDRFVAATTVAATGYSTPATTTSALGITYGTAADTIDILSSVAALTNAKIRVWAIVQDLTGLDTTDYKTYA